MSKIKSILILMVDAVVGSLIVVLASSALVLAIEVAEKSMHSAGRQPLNTSEVELLQRAGLSDSDSLNKLQADLQDLPRQ